MDAFRRLLRQLGPLRTVDRFVERPVATQRHLLRGLLRRAARTEWGQRYDFAAIARAPDVVAAYQDQVPRHHYEDIEADVKRVRAGAADVMWPGTITNFAVSSGTVSDGKIIPISDESVAKNRAFSIGTGLNYLAETLNARFLLGKHLTLPGRIEEDPNYPGTLVGEVSGILAEYAPGYFQALFQAVPNEVTFMANWEKKLRAIAERTVDQDVRMLVMAPTWALVLFDELVDAYNRRHGGGASSVADVWPNLQLFVAGGVALRSYRTLLEEEIGKPVDFVETYGASEGFFSFQNAVDDPAMLLHLDNGLFYEFVPLDEMGDADAQRCTIADVEPGVRYALYVTSCSGLWSYGVGDVVRFTQTFPHKIEVAGRTSEMIDKYGEALFSEEARQALRAACEATGARFTDFHVAPYAEGRTPGHQWLVEFKTRPDALDAFACTIDDYLQTVNRHYQIRREARAFAAPRVTALPEGTFYDWMKKTRGSVSGQSKVPRLSETRDVADAVLDVAGRQAATAMGGVPTPESPASESASAENDASAEGTSTENAPSGNAPPS